PCSPADVVETRVVSPVIRFFTKISVNALVSPGTRFEAELANTTRVPSEEKIAVPPLVPFDCEPSDAVEIRSISVTLSVVPKLIDGWVTTGLIVRLTLLVALAPLGS